MSENNKNKKRLSKRWALRIAIIAVTILLAIGTGVGIYARYTMQKAVTGKITIKAGFGGVGLYEHAPVYSNGQYGYPSDPGDPVTSFTYTILPGVDLPCDAYARVEKLTVDHPAWLIVGISGSGSVYGTMTSDWSLLTQTNGVSYYAYAVNNTPAALVKGEGVVDNEGSCTVGVFDKINVPYYIDSTASGTAITVSAYLVEKRTNSPYADFDWAVNSQTPSSETYPDLDTSLAPVYAGAGDDIVNSFTVMTASGVAAPVVGANNTVAVTVPELGFPVFVRAVYTVNWVDDSGSVWGEAPVEGVDYLLTINDTDWFLKNGFWYLKNAVTTNGSTGAVTTAQLVSVEQLSDAQPPEGYTLKVQAAAQYIQAIGYIADGSNAPFVTRAWGVVYNANDLSISAS